MGRVAAVLKQSNPFADFVRAFAPIAMQGMDERKKQEENAALGQMYLEAMRGPADAAVAPYQANAIQSQDDAYRKQVVAESSAMTDAAIANNPALTQRVAGISPAPAGYTGNVDLTNRPSVRQPDGSIATVKSMGFNIDGKEVLLPTVSDDGRMLTPEQAIAQFKATGKHLGTFNTPEESTAFAKALSAQQGKYYGINNDWQANNQQALGQANNQAQSAEQMLAMAKEKYGTAMFDRLAPIVASGKVPAQAMISIIEKQVQTAEKQAIKQATANAVKILSDPKADPAQKQGVLAQLMIDNPQAARGMAEAFGLKQQDPKLSIAPDGRVVDMRTGQPVNGAPVYNKPDKPTGQLTEYQRYQMQKDKENPVDKVQNIPGFGNITNSQILSLYTSSQPKETQREVFNPITGQKEMVKSVDPGKPETIALLKPYVDKIKGVTNQQPATGATSEPPIDEVVASVKANGEEQTLKLLTEAFGAKKAEELLGRSRAYSK